LRALTARMPHRAFGQAVGYRRIRCRAGRVRLTHSRSHAGAPTAAARTWSIDQRSSRSPTSMTRTGSEPVWSTPMMCTAAHPARDTATAGGGPRDKARTAIGSPSTFAVVGPAFLFCACFASAGVGKTIGRMPGLGDVTPIQSGERASHSMCGLSPASLPLGAGRLARPSHKRKQPGHDGKPRLDAIRSAVVQTFKNLPRRSQDMHSGSRQSAPIAADSRPRRSDGRRDEKAALPTLG
jgi:hypothetical protein